MENSPTTPLNPGNTIAETTHDHQRSFDLTGNQFSVHKLLASQIQIAVINTQDDSPNPSPVPDSETANRSSVPSIVPDPEPAQPSLFTRVGHWFQDCVQPIRCQVLLLTGQILFQSSQQLGNASDLNRAIAAFESITELTPDRDSAKPRYLDNLGMALRRRFEQFADLPDIQNSISAHEKAVSLVPVGDPNRPGYLSNLGSSFIRRFEYLGLRPDLSQAISVQETAVQLVSNDHPSKPLFLNNLGVSFKHQFQNFGELSDLHMAISTQETAVSLTPDGHSDKPGFLTNLGNSLLLRFDRLGDLSDLEFAIKLQEEALKLIPDGHPDKPSHLTNLGMSYFSRFERLGDLQDLSRAISAETHAVKLTPDCHPNLPSRLTSLGNSVMRQFEHLGSMPDLEFAISAQENAVELTPDNHPSKPTRLNSLGLTFLQRFERLGDLSDAGKAISAIQEAIRLNPNDHPDQARWMNNLGTALIKRFEQLGELADIEDATLAFEKAAEQTDGGANKSVYLDNLGMAFQGRFTQLKESSDIDKAILHQEMAVQLTPAGHPARSRHLGNLGNSFLRRFEFLGELSDIEGAIFAKETALTLISYGHPAKSRHLDSLGTSFLVRFEHLGEISDLEKAISTHRHAVQLTPDGHPDMPIFLNNLANSFKKGYHTLGDSSMLQQAISLYSQAAQSPVGPALDRFWGASNWAELSEILGESPVDAYNHALGLLPRVAWLGLAIADRHKHLSNIGNIVRDAAAAAIASKQYEVAIEWLEQGRTIVWNQLLQLRLPIDDLYDKDPLLAKQLKDVSRKLEQVSTRQPFPEIDLLPERITRDHHSLALERDKLVEKARAIPGFEKILLPKTIVELRATSNLKTGYIVILNVHRRRCDALVLNLEEDGITHIPLETFDYEKAQTLQKSLKSLQSASISIRSPNRDVEFLGEAAPVHMASFKEILADLWIHVAKPISDHLAFSISPGREPPHIWWCPTGPLAFLPIHAAGLYDTEEPGTKLSEFAVSSYTPTITTLFRTLHATQKDQFKLLAISQPSTDNELPLPNTPKEVECIKQHASGLHVEWLNGDQAAVEKVVKGMTECCWIHLACHGDQNIANPTNSALILADGKLELSTIIKTALPHAEFAFLSACKTAKGDVTLEEEAVHVAAGMLLVGYRGVIATMWAIRDTDGPVVADGVYAELFKNGQPDQTRAAYALHHAVQGLRQSGTHFMDWVPFIHFGV